MDRDESKIFKAFIESLSSLLGNGNQRQKYLSPDYREARVQMKMRWYNRNYVRTHFGGSLYAMTDPFFMLMLIHILGKDYVVWDKAAHIEFIKASQGTVTARFSITEEQIEKILQSTAGGQKYLPEFSVDIKDKAGEKVARVTKTLYVKRKMLGATDFKTQT